MRPFFHHALADAVHPRRQLDTSVVSTLTWNIWCSAGAGHANAKFMNCKICPWHKKKTTYAHYKSVECTVWTGIRKLRNSSTFKIKMFLSGFINVCYVTQRKWEDAKVHILWQLKRNRMQLAAFETWQPLRRFEENVWNVRTINAGRIKALTVLFAYWMEFQDMKCTQRND